MPKTDKFSPSEQKVIEQLLKGKSNKQIASAVGIAKSTVEFHLNHIYKKLKVDSRAEAILKLGKTIGMMPEQPKHSTVAESDQRDYGNEKPKWKFEREAKFPDDHTVGQTISRSNAFGLEVHGLFGAVQAWPAQPGHAKYGNINIPETDQIYLMLRYSKHSSASTPILIFIDDEPSPRGRIVPTDQGNWNRFVWSEPIPLGKVKGGIHSITFYTDGQEYGVADLDKFILTTEPP